MSNRNSFEIHRKQESNPFEDVDVFGPPTTNKSTTSIKPDLSRFPKQESSSSEFNPFVDVNPVVPTSSSTITRNDFSPAVLPELPKSNTSENEKVLNEIQKHEKALIEYENKIKQQEEKLKANDESMTLLKVNNFPPCPRCFPCKSCFYQNFEVDIDAKYRHVVKFSFYMWLTYSVVLLLNVFGTLSFMFASGVTNDTGATFGVGLLMVILMPPLTYVLCFRPIYRGFRSHSSVNFFAFFLFFTVEIIILIIQSLGLNTLGSCGWINSISISSKYLGVKIFMILIASGFTALAILSILLLIKVNSIYRTTGATFDKAKAEMRNQTISAALHA